MAKGENIFKRKDGRWEARYIKGYELSGKIKYGFCYGKSYKEAKEKVTKCKTALMNGKPAPQTSVKHRFGFYCDEWLQSGKNRYKESTYIKYSGFLENYIKPKLGGCYPLGFSTEIVEAFTSELLVEEDLSAKTVKDILVVLRSILNYTAKQFTGIFPVLEINYPRETKKEIRVLSKEEQQTFVSFLLRDMDACKFGILFSLLTGLRIGEICALRWNHISITEQTVKIDSTLQRLHDTENASEGKTRIVIGTPKSDTSTRIIPLTDSLTELCEQMQPDEPSAYVLTGTESYMEPRALQYRLKKYTMQCGLEGVHFHTLRHTFATRCVEVGFEIKSLSEILGHANTTITLEKYVHSSLELKRDNMNKLSAVGL